MNGSTTINGPNNEQIIGKFQVINLDKLPMTSLPNPEDTIPQMPIIPDESAAASRFQMIRVDRNFGRGRWKVNDYEPPENMSTSMIPPVTTIDTESLTIPNNSAFVNLPATTMTNLVAGTVPTVVPSDANGSSSAAALAATAASAAAATATAFQQQQQMALINPPQQVQAANVPPPAGLLHAYPPAPLPNQPYLLPNHPQFGYYPFYPAPYPSYATSWAAAAAALAASNPYLQQLAPPQPTPSQLPPATSITDPIRLGETDINNDNPVMSSGNFPNVVSDHLQTAQLAATASFLYNTQHSHPAFVQHASSTTSPYATIPAYHPLPSLPTIIPRNQPSQTFLSAQVTSNNTTDITSNSSTTSSLQAPTQSSPKHEPAKNVSQQLISIPTTKPKPLVTTVGNIINNEPSKTSQVVDLISSSPLIKTSQSIPPTLISPININPTNPSASTLTNIWSYTTNGSPLNLTQTAQTAAVTAAAAIGLLNNESNQTTEMANEILKELTTPTKQNNTTDIDNKISAAMDLVKMHLLSAVRDEVTELRQQIRTLHEKINSAEHENAFLRQYVPSDILAQYIPTLVGLSLSSDTINSTATSLLSSSQPTLINSLSSIPSSIVQQPISLSSNPPLTSITSNLPTT